MKFLVAFAALIASTSAFCPNLCNGHGKCGNQDRCTCYTYSGTTRGDNVNYYEISNQRAAWTGADCSLRTCPLAFSWSGSTPKGLSLTKSATVDATALNKFTVSLTDAEADYLTVTGSIASSMVSRGSAFKVSNTANYLQEDCGVSGNSGSKILTCFANADVGAANAAISVSFEGLEVDEAGAVDYDPASGDFSQWDANGAHDLLECAGQGLCDRSTGQCNCFPGYEGEACTRTVCPNGCSGHGTCIEAYRIASDFGNTYNLAWDQSKHFGCKCDVGFRGPDCSLQECPSDYDPLNGCGGGRCNVGGSYTAKDGTVTRCPNDVAATTTLNNVQYSIGTSDCQTGEQRDCSGRGICDYTSGICKCFSGFFGESCNIQTVLV